VPTYTLPYLPRSPLLEIFFPRAFIMAGSVFSSAISLVRIKISNFFTDRTSDILVYLRGFIVFHQHVYFLFAREKSQHYRNETSHPGFQYLKVMISYTYNKCLYHVDYSPDRNSRPGRAPKTLQ
jgi:hypothetical protein